jgi:hypothetical protein
MRDIAKKIVEMFAAGVHPIEIAAASGWELDDVVTLLQKRGARGPAPRTGSVRALAPKRPELHPRAAEAVIYRSVRPCEPVKTGRSRNISRAEMTSIWYNARPQTPARKDPLPWFDDPRVVGAKQ